MVQFQDLKSLVTTILGLQCGRERQEMCTYYVILPREACGNEGSGKIDLQTLIP
jgi:hypothetical protein